MGTVHTVVKAFVALLQDLNIAIGVGNGWERSLKQDMMDRCSECNKTGKLRDVECIETGRFYRHWIQTKHLCEECLHAKIEERKITSVWVMEVGKRSVDKTFPYTTAVACCHWPPSKDGSLCAGGNCACKEDYVCEKCTAYPKEDENGHVWSDAPMEYTTGFPCRRCGAISDEPSGKEPCTGRVCPHLCSEGGACDGYHRLGKCDCPV